MLLRWSVALFLLASMLAGASRLGFAAAGAAPGATAAAGIVGPAAEHAAASPAFVQADAPAADDSPDPALAWAVPSGPARTPAGAPVPAFIPTRLAPPFLDGPRRPPRAHGLA